MSVYVLCPCTGHAPEKAPTTRAPRLRRRSSSQHLDPGSSTRLRTRVPRGIPGPGLPVRHQVLDETRIAIHLRSGAQGAVEAGAGQLYYAHHDLLVLAVGREEFFLQQLIDLFDGMELLVEGEVAGELIAPVRYLDDRPRLGLELLEVYLDHP